MGATTGLLITSVSIGQIFGPILFGVIADAFGIDISLVVGGVVGLIGAIIGFFYLNRGKSTVQKKY